MCEDRRSLGGGRWEKLRRGSAPGDRVPNQIGLPRTILGLPIPESDERCLLAHAPCTAHTRWLEYVSCIRRTREMHCSINRTNIKQ